jgi:hypothetical protein
MAEHINNLPKDLIMTIMRKFDMDTRIKAGVIGKLKVPHSLKRKITSSLNLRKPIPNWMLLEKRYDLISQVCAVKFPLSEDKAYELYYDGGGFYFSDSSREIYAILYTSHVDILWGPCGFPDVSGLPTDFVERHPEWIVKVDSPMSNQYICIQPGSCFKTQLTWFKTQ